MLEHMLAHALLLAALTQTAPASALPDPSWVQTKHTITLHGAPLAYTATVGLMPLKNEAGDLQAKMFFMAYTKDGEDKASRPVTFCWNGGPGASSIYIHMGCAGPRTVHLNSDGSMPNPPFRLEDNQDTLLDKTDLVFVDPIGTGFSELAPKVEGKEFWGIDGDIKSIGNFIRLYITDTGRWDSPVFLAGESYGTFRNAGLSNAMHDHGLALSGIVEISSAVNFNIFIPYHGNELPYMLYIPSYTAIAGYHKKLSPDLGDPDKAIKEAEQFASGEYWHALEAGDDLSNEKKHEIAAKLAHFTGLSEEYCLQTNLRIDPNTFMKELGRKEGYTVGRFDARVEGADSSQIGAYPEYDPSDSSLTPPIVSAFNGYIRNELGYKTDNAYNPLNLNANAQWNWGNTILGYPDESDELRQAMTKNTHLRVLDCQGLFDLATPFYGSNFTFKHLGLPDNLKSHIEFAYFQGGHMMYVNRAERTKLHDRIVRFMDEAAQG